MRKRSRSRWYNWGKSTQNYFCLTIRSCFQLRKSGHKTLRSDKEQLVRPWVELSNSQYEQLKKLREKTDKPMSEIIQQAVSRFVRKEYCSVSVAACSLPKATRENYKTLTAYFPRHEWDLLQRMSENTGRCKTELLRKAVEEYLRKLP